MRDSTFDSMTYIICHQYRFGTRNLGVSQFSEIAKDKKNNFVHHVAVVKSQAFRVFSDLACSDGALVEKLSTTYILKARLLHCSVLVAVKFCSCFHQVFGMPSVDDLPKTI